MPERPDDNRTRIKRLETQVAGLLQSRRQRDAIMTSRINWFFGKLNNPLAVGSSTTMEVHWDVGGSLTDSTGDITVHAPPTLTGALAQDSWVWASRHPRDDKWWVMVPPNQSHEVSYWGKLDNTLVGGGPSKTFSIWLGDPLADSGENVTAHAPPTLLAGTELSGWAKATWMPAYGKWYVTDWLGVAQIVVADYRYDTATNKLQKKTVELEVRAAAAESAWTDVHQATTQVVVTDYQYDTASNVFQKKTIELTTLEEGAESGWTTVHTATSHIVVTDYQYDTATNKFQKKTISLTTLEEGAESGWLDVHQATTHTVISDFQVSGLTFQTKTIELTTLEEGAESGWGTDHTGTNCP